MCRLKPLLLLAFLALTAGCAGESGWVNPDVPKERWNADLTQCRRMADRDMGSDAYLPPGDERTGDPMKLVDRSRNAKRYDTLVRSCMENRGYHR